MPQQEKEPISLNNFYFNLPNGLYRGLEESDEEKKMVGAIDELLAGEFSSLDTARIYGTIMDAHRAISDALSSGQAKTTEEVTKAIAPYVAISKEANEELRPLFNRLVELGFNPKILTR